MTKFMKIALVALSGLVPACTGNGTDGDAATEESNLQVYQCSKEASRRDCKDAGLVITDEKPESWASVYRENKREIAFTSSASGGARELVVTEQGAELIHFSGRGDAYQVSILGGRLVARGTLASGIESVEGDVGAAQELDAGLLGRGFEAITASGVDFGDLWGQFFDGDSSKLSRSPEADASYFCGTATMCAFAVLICQDRQCGDAGCPAGGATYPCGICFGFPTGFYPPVEPPHFPAYCH